MANGRKFLTRIGALRQIGGKISAPNRGGDGDGDGDREKFPSRDGDGDKD